MILSRAAFQSLLLAATVAAVNMRAAPASDWPQLLGPTRDGVYAGPPLTEQWPKNGPPVLWTVTVGEGYSNPIVGEGRVVICHRIADELVVDALDPKTGSQFWSFKHAMKFQDGAYFDSGPRPTPAIRDGKVFVCNVDGYFVALDLKDGKKLWSHHVKSKFGSSATWHGCVSSPLATDSAVILHVGGSNASVVAFAPATGEVLWKALDEKASASSPVLATFDGKPQVLIATRTAFHSLDASTGKDLWQIPARKQSSGNVYAANPVVMGDRVFLSGWYKLGALLLRVKDNNPEKLWHLDNAISTHYASGIVYGDHIYGFHGHAWEGGGPNLRCVELATGKVLWEQPKAGSGTIVRFADNLLILSETGELQLARASPKEFKVRSRFQVVGRTTRNYPALADGFAYIRGPKKLVCVDLRSLSGN
jgi:outer membrane protein assembly factor BamB